MDFTIFNYKGKDEAGNHQREKIGYLTTYDGKDKLKVNIEAMEKAIADYRQYAKDNGKDVGEHLYFDVFENKREQGRGR